MYRTKKFINKISKIMAVLTALLICASSKYAFAAPGVKLQLYFAPHIMNDITGEITVDVNVRNFDAAVPDYLGTMCGVTFSFEYDAEQFDIKNDKNGVPEVIVDENTMVASAADIESKSNTNRVTFTFMDSTLMNNLIDSDGTLFKFTLISKNVSALWNSNDTYPIRFVAESIGTVMYDVNKYQVNSFYGAEGIDGKVGGYNIPPTLIPKSVDKHLTFTDDSTEFSVDGETAAMDVPAVVKEGKPMIPVRCLAESRGMDVEWNGDVMVASAYGDCRTLKILQESGRIYINSAVYTPEVAPFEENGRIYISGDTITALCGAEVTENNGAVTIYIP